MLINSYLKTKIVISLLIFVFLVTTGLRCGQVTEEALAPVKLTYWRVLEGQDAFGKIINDFQAQHPHVSISVRKLRLEEYEQALLEAWAEDKGPDLFAIPSSWLGKYEKFILPMPRSMKIHFLTIKPATIFGYTVKEERIIETKSVAGLTSRDLRDIFVDIIPEDVLRDEKIYGLPMALDTLVLYYNRDLLNNAGIVAPPADWQEFADQVKRLTLIDKKGNIIQAGAALGGARNVEGVVDILSLLMMQNGTQMSEGARATFNQASRDDPSYFPGQEALRFYTDFANPNKEVYTWNEEMPGSFEAFVQGKLAFFLGYSWHLALIKAQAPKLNFDIASMPQIEKDIPKKVNFANYWIETVSKKTKYSNECWAFLKFATETKNVVSYLDATKKPTAHRAIIPKQKQDFDLRIFADQVLTSKSWYRGKNFPAVEEIFQEMIEAVLQGEEIKKAIDTAAQKVSQTL